MLAGEKAARLPSRWVWVASLHCAGTAPDARSMYYDIDVEKQMSSSQGIRYYSPNDRCLEQWAVGSTESGVGLSTLKMRCGNKLLKLTVLGDGDSDEFVQLFGKIDQFFAGSFSW